MVTSPSFVAKHPALYLKRIGAAGRSLNYLIFVIASTFKEPIAA